MWGGPLRAASDGNVSFTLLAVSTGIGELVLEKLLAEACDLQHVGMNEELSSMVGTYSDNLDI